MNAVQSRAGGLWRVERRNFAPFFIKDLTGESTSHYEMTPDVLALWTLAAIFGKEHRHVLEAIDNILKSLAAEKSAAEIRAFTLVPFTDETQPGREFRSFAMNRDGFTLLAMGFTGARPLRPFLCWAGRDPIALRALFFISIDRAAALTRCAALR
ncbi:MAG: hypothetical protein C3F11_13990 [Methylocystaceae bacterium]|nr:MAG: hypothetical protein C3F11_13990 [Methylocystaceae bacterium]